MLNHNIKNYYKNVNCLLNRLIIYRGIMEDEIIKKLRILFQEICDKENDIEEIENIYFEITSKLLKNSEHLSLNGDLLSSYISYLVVTDKNEFVLKAAKYGSEISSGLYHAAKHDFDILKTLINLDMNYVSTMVSDRDGFLGNFESNFNNLKGNYIDKVKTMFLKYEQTEDILNRFIKFINENGMYQFFGNAFFKWTNTEGFTSVEEYDSIRIKDIIGYDYQKNILMKNTEAFAGGAVSENILLTGARGTGKSSSVKAVINEFSNKNVKMIEINKTQMLYAGNLMNSLRSHNNKFIIFIDDLSFEESETDYKIIKSIIDGSTEKRPENVLFYVTSNRRHIVKESWSERETSNEVHLLDSMNEKLSFSDRFGITLHYMSPNQIEYLDIVLGIAKKELPEIEEEILKKEAIKWEINQNGRSGRTARQFINYMMRNTNRKGV